MCSVITDFRGIYGSYSQKYKKLGKEVRFIILDGKDQDSTEILLLYTDSNCSEMINNLKIALTKHEKFDFKLSDDDYLNIVIPFIFDGF